MSITITANASIDDQKFIDGIIDKNGKPAAVQEVEEDQPCLACKDKCPGYSPHQWRNICKHCKCLRQVHDIGHADFVNVWERLGLVQPADPERWLTKDKAHKLGYAWVPAGLGAKQVQEYMDGLENTKVPRLGSPGEHYRNLQLVVQLPRQDLSADHCRQLKLPAGSAAFEEFSQQRETRMDVAHARQCKDGKTPCHKCESDIDASELCVTASKVGEKVVWHPACFVCAKCDELLVDLAYCYDEEHGAIYCVRHYADTVKPRCAACDELIFASEYTKAMDADWHSGHFCCWSCDFSLAGHRYVLREEHPYCIKCYENMFANKCEECKAPIGTDSKDLSYKDKHWHEKCFKCTDCHASLVDQPFAAKGDKLYCANCHDNAFAARCDGCGTVFKAGTKKFEYKGKQWHEQCFCCKICKLPIGTKSFVPHEQEVVCVTCYEDQYAQRCFKCKEVINKGGVSYKGSTWHRDCFSCPQCNKVLAGDKFLSNDDKPYCVDCYGELFAKKCNGCKKPITGLGGSKFISFEDRQWHSDCFTCSKCQTSLVGKGFMQNGEDVLCPDCGDAA